MLLLPTEEQDNSTAVINQCLCDSGSSWWFRNVLHFAVLLSACLWIGVSIVVLKEIGWVLWRAML